MNREYEIALQWVRQHYPQLYRNAEHVVLVPNLKMTESGALGLCSRDNYVAIADGRRTVGEFVDTIVHELTHCRQNRNRNLRMSDLKREEEAYQAGIEAANRYVYQAAPWAVQKGKGK